MSLHVDEKDVVKNPIEYIVNRAIKHNPRTRVSNDTEVASNDTSKDPSKDPSFSLNKKVILASVSTLLFLILSNRSMSVNEELYIFARGIIFFILFLTILYFMKV
jgi:hypothetical protein